MSTTTPTSAAMPAIGGLEQAHPPTRFRLMDDDELADVTEVLTRELFVIQVDMEEDDKAGRPRGERWRFAAGRAKAYRQADLHLAQTEQRARHARAAGPMTHAGEDIGALQEAALIAGILDRAAQRGCLEMMRSMAAAMPQDTDAISAMVAWRVANGQESGLIWVDDRWHIPSIQGGMP